jgi:hypothetical protein
VTGLWLMDALGNQGNMAKCNIIQRVAGKTLDSTEELWAHGHRCSPAIGPAHQHDSRTVGRYSSLSCGNRWLTAGSVRVSFTT